MTHWSTEYSKWLSKSTVHKMLMRNGVDRPKKDLVNIDKYGTGSYCKVFTECYDEDGKKIAIKILKESSSDDDNIELYSEWVIHDKVYQQFLVAGIEKNCVRPLWVRMISFNGGQRVICLGMECFDKTLYKYLLREKGDTTLTREWKKEIISSLNLLRQQVGFYHRDLHINNVGVLGDNWQFFDFGMTMIDNIKPWQRPGISFYAPLEEIQSDINDERILRFSWGDFGDRDREFINGEILKIRNSSPQKWKREMPVKIKGHKLSKRGTFICIEKSGTLLVSLPIRENKRRKAESGNQKHIKVSFKTSDITPDTEHRFIQYYIPTIC